MSAGSELQEFFAKIDVDRQELVNAETIRDLHLLLDRPAGDFAALRPEDYMKLLAELDGALTLQIGLPNLPPLLSIVSGQVSLPLLDGQKAIASLKNDLVLRLNLNVAKGPLLAHWGINGGDLFIRSFLYHESLLRLLQANLQTLDKHLFGAPDRATLVVLEDAETPQSGDLLHIAGVPEARQIQAVDGGLAPDLRRQLEAYRTTAKNSLSWAGFQLKNITPLHFIVSNSAGQRVSGSANSKQQHAKSSEKISNLLATHALTANVLYTANRSQFDGGVFEAHYAATDNTATVRLPETSEFSPDTAALANWATWPFSGDEGDRLTFLQNVTARDLSSDDPDQNYAALNQHLAHILNEARWHNRVFVDGQIDGHFEDLQELGDTVSDAAGAVGSTIDALTKGFVDALLGAVGVIVLTLLAALVESSRPDVIFRVGMIGYALYLVFFQGFYRMGSLLHSFRLLEKETQAQLAAYEKRLGKSRVAPAREQLSARRGQFWTWFWITGALYVLVAIFLIFLAAWLPGWLAATP